MKKPDRVKRIEHTAKTLFNLTHSVHDMHTAGWPRWVNENDKESYRQLAAWHHKQLSKEHAWMWKMVKSWQAISSKFAKEAKIDSERRFFRSRELLCMDMLDELNKRRK